MVYALTLHCGGTAEAATPGAVLIDVFLVVVTFLLAFATLVQAVKVRRAH